MVSVFQVGNFFINRLKLSNLTIGSDEHIRLQKLVYYAQARVLVKEGRPLFAERLEAWRKGPVAPDLYFDIVGSSQSKTRWAAALPEPYAAIAEGVAEVYGMLTAKQLIDLSHQEPPWHLARGSIPLWQKSNAQISIANMIEFYTQEFALADQINKARQSGVAWTGTLDNLHEYFEMLDA